MNQARTRAVIARSPRRARPQPSCPICTPEFARRALTGQTAGDGHDGIRRQREMTRMQPCGDHQEWPGRAAVTAVGLQAGPAQAHPLAPKQYFTGVINGKDGNTTVPITITMNCPGPGRPGRTGHPLAGQTLAVHQLFPPAAGRLARLHRQRLEDRCILHRSPARRSPARREYPGVHPLRPLPAATHRAHPALLRNQDSLVHPDPGGPALPVSHRPSPVREQTLSVCF